MGEAGFENEAALCSTFIAALDKRWTAYAETGGFDVLLSRNSDGFQIGVQAKLRLNARVIAQVTESHYDLTRAGPDCRAVLVPRGARISLDWQTICGRLALTMIQVSPFKEAFRLHQYDPRLPATDDHWSSYDERTWHELCPVERLPLPDYVPDVAAGAASPVVLTDWKIKAIKIASLLDVVGTVTRYDFKALKIDIRRWIDGRWIVSRGDHFVAGDRLPDFAAQHPRNFAEIKADIGAWAPPPQQSSELPLRRAL